VACQRRRWAFGVSTCQRRTNTMLCSQEVLSWPYGDFEQMVPCSSIDLSGLQVMSLDNCKSLYKRPSSLDAKSRPVQAELQGKSLRGHYISNTDRNKGHLAETAFAEAMERMGLEVKVLPHFSHNYLKHIDFEIASAASADSDSADSDSAASFWIDVKSAKSLRKTMNKSDAFNKPQDKYICFELNSSGSLFGSHSDYVAFGLTNGSFIVADRHKIIDIVNAKMDFTGRPKERSAWPETALWHPYVRSYNNNHLVMAYMDLEDLRPSFLFLVAAAVADVPAAAVVSPELAHMKAAIVPAASAATAPAAAPAAVPGPTTTAAHHAKLS
jgi:hypothetical protein